MSISNLISKLPVNREYPGFVTIANNKQCKLNPEVFSLITENVHSETKPYLLHTACSQMSAEGNLSPSLRYVLSKVLVGLTGDLCSGHIYWHDNRLTFHSTVFWVSLCRKLLSLLVKALALCPLLGEHTCLCEHIPLHKGSLGSEESGNPKEAPDSKEKEKEGKMGKQRGGYRRQYVGKVTHKS